MKAARPFTEPLTATGAPRREPAVATPLTPASRRVARTPRVLVVHEDPLLALGAFSALMSAPDVRAFLDGSDAFACSSEAIDVVVADLAHGLGLATTPKVQRGTALRDARVLVLESAAREHNVRKAFGAGVFGYALSSAGLAELSEAVAMVSRGARYVSPALAGQVAESLMREALSPREAEVLALIAEGHCNKVIARQLGITVGTVKVHVKAIMSKLDATSRTHALSIAIERGLA
ncbi:LuxR C-terminal-related transcriptional regulator [Roseateles sp.]|uniref:LuxR C-terminal-related transcriptional regulator n=1 Tax=Roseateles sp. TaxID=1971397 RepID=UPI0039E735D4